MDMENISQVTRKYQVSTRTLRYYEELGLLTSHRIEGYAYRVYDQEAVGRLRQILLLRKLRIPLKHIGEILQDDSQQVILKIFFENINQLDREITALSTVRGLLQRLVRQLYLREEEHGLPMPEDSALLSAVESLGLSNLQFREGENAMEVLNKAEEELISMKDVRILFLPPATIAASHFVGENPEIASGAKLEAFIREAGLLEKKPDFRIYGFNNPNPQREGEQYGYELWATIPPEMEVSAPLVKKQFAGGLYAAHMIKMGDFHEWGPFYEWAMHNEKYLLDPREPMHMGGCMEEHLNAHSYYNAPTGTKALEQLDLLIPIRPKEEEQI